jgi:hypothetical protein
MIQRLVTIVTVGLSSLCVLPAQAGVTCVGDINGDCMTDLSDLARLLTAFGTCPGDAAYDAAANIATDDDCIDLYDLTTLLSDFGCDALPPGCFVFADILSSNDTVERAAGAFVQKNIAAITALNFSELKFLMRPMTVTAGPPGGFLQLSVDAANVVEIYTATGTRLDLPALVNPGDTFYINGIGFGTVAIDANYFFPCGAFCSDTVRVRVDCFPGLAGETLTAYPHFNFVNVFEADASVRVGVDPQRHAERVGARYDVYIVAHKTAAQWVADNTLTDVTVAVENETLAAGGIQDNVAFAWGVAGPVGLYDVVLDFCDGGNGGPNGRFDPGDIIGQLTTSGFRAEVEVVTDPGAAAAGAIATFDYDLSATTGTFRLRPPFDGLTANYDAHWIGRVVHPNPVPHDAPLVVIAHGNHFPRNVPIGTRSVVDNDLTSDENYRGYTYLQEFLARHGFVTVSLSLDDAFFAEADLSGISAPDGAGGMVSGAASVMTSSGIRFRGWMVLKTIEAVLGDANLAAAGGAGFDPTQIDAAQIHLLGHSRGGEAVLQAWKLLSQPANRPKTAGGTAENLAGVRDPAWTLRSICSVAPVSFINDAPPNGNAAFPPFLLIYGTADGDVNGLTLGVQPYRHYDRARNDKQAIVIIGGNHNHWNSSWPCDDATQSADVVLGSTDFPWDDVSCGALPNNVGANLVNAANQRAVLQAYYHAFLKRYDAGERAMSDYFARPPNRFRPASVAAAVPLHNQYRPALADGFSLVMDDYEDGNTNLGESSSLQTVDSANLVTLIEPDLGDPFETNAANFAQQTRAAILEWNAAGANYLESIAAGANRDMTRHNSISFRVAQQPLQAETVALDADMELTVTLIDQGNRTSSIVTSALTTIPRVYPARLPRAAANSSTEAMFKTIRLNPCLFKTNGRNIDIDKIKEIRFDLTPSARGRIGFDDLDLTLR